MVRVCVRMLCCFGDTAAVSLFSTPLKLDVRSQSLCGLWFASLPTSQQLVWRLRVGKTLACCALRLDGHRIAGPVWVWACLGVLPNMHLLAGELFPVVFLIPTRALASDDYGEFLLCSPRVFFSCSLHKVQE